jgi:phage terminase large subunit-like protein
VAIDEFHEHPTSIVADKMRAGTKGRRQALIFTITNSGYDRTSACWTHHDYSAKLLRGLAGNDAWFCYICQLDPCEKCEGEGHDTPVDNCPDCDDWRDEKTWLKANPGLDTILPSKYLREQVAEARGMPSKEGIVRRLNFCQWTQIATHAIPMDKWDACKTEIDLEELAGKECYGGLDIGATSDFTAFPLLFPRDDAVISAETGEQLWRRSYTLLPFFWLPQNPRRRDERTTALIDQWRRLGLVKTTPGEVVDYDVVVADIVELSQRYRILEIGFDRGFQGAQIGTNLMAHFGASVLFTVPQGIISMNAPFREFLELIVTGRIRHDGNAVMRWHCANTASEQRGGLIKPSKDLSAEKIDGVTGAVMALARAMLRPPADTAPSVNFI